MGYLVYSYSPDGVRVSGHVSDGGVQRRPIVGLVQEDGIGGQVVDGDDADLGQLVADVEPVDDRNDELDEYAEVRSGRIDHEDEISGRFTAADRRRRR